jgi:hypothetical protein
MRITTSDIDPLAEVECLGRLLHASIAANRYQEAGGLAARCVALHGPSTHHVIVSILTRARHIAILQRSLLASRLASVRRAAEYLDSNPPSTHGAVRG